MINDAGKHEVKNGNPSRPNGVILTMAQAELMPFQRAGARPLEQRLARSKEAATSLGRSLEQVFQCLAQILRLVETEN
jgi:hypothetical protein